MDKMQLLSMCVLQTAIWNANGSCSLTTEWLLILSCIKRWYFLSEFFKERVFDSLRISEKRDERAELSGVGHITSNSVEIPRCHSSWEHSSGTSQLSSKIVPLIMKCEIPILLLKSLLSPVLLPSLPAILLWQKDSEL